MKKTYEAPEMFAVTLQHQNSILLYSIQNTDGGNTGITGPEQDDPDEPGYGGGDVKGFTSDDLWNNEW